MDLQLVILAAGLGSRYGGMKQLEGVGPGGATLMEYSLYDARRAGFDEAIFVIRSDMEEAFGEFANARFGAGFPWRTAIQRLEDVPSGVLVPPDRKKPWGTAQAVLAAADRVHAPFAVLNADDFYDAPSFSALAGHLRAHAGDQPPSYAVVGFRLGDTVPEAGGVNRGWCRADSRGWLESVEEVIRIAPAPGGFAGAGESGPVVLPADALVSMNLWGFTPAVFDTLRRGFAEFFLSGDPARGEYLIPTAIRAALERRECRVRVLDAGSRWFGVTHPADRPAVTAALQQLVRNGRYPERLWE